MCKSAVPLALLLSSLAVCGCSDDRTTLSTTGPSVFGTAPFAGIQPTTLVAQLVANPFCPLVPPFFAPFNLIVRADGSANLFLDQVRLGFVDASGISAPQITLTQPSLTAQFGSTMIAAGSSRAFPLSLQFGCGLRRSGTLAIDVTIRSDRGRDQSMRLTVPVR